MTTEQVLRELIDITFELVKGIGRPDLWERLEKMLVVWEKQLGGKGK